jgi:hypothetical protein
MAMRDRRSYHELNNTGYGLDLNSSTTLVSSNIADGERLRDR